jgi:hypothetical protein
MTDYAIMVKHSGFVDRFLAQDTPPDRIGWEIWWAIDPDEQDILRFRSRESALACKRKYELNFAAKGEKGYSFVVMKTVMVPVWRVA